MEKNEKELHFHGIRGKEMSNPIKSLSGKEWGIWLGSLAVVIASNLLPGDLDLLTLLAALVGATSLIFAAKGNV